MIRFLRSRVAKPNPAITVPESGSGTAVGVLTLKNIRSVCCEFGIKLLTERVISILATFCNPVTQTSPPCPKSGLAAVSCTKKSELIPTADRDVELVEKYPEQPGARALNSVTVDQVLTSIRLLLKSQAEIV